MQIMVCVGATLKVQGLSEAHFEFIYFEVPRVKMYQLMQMYLNVYAVSQWVIFFIW